MNLPSAMVAVDLNERLMIQSSGTSA